MMKTILLIMLLITSPVYAGVNFGGMSDSAVFSNDLPDFKTYEEALLWGVKRKGIKEAEDNLQIAIKDMWVKVNKKYPINEAAEAAAIIPFYDMALAGVQGRVKVGAGVYAGSVPVE